MEWKILQRIQIEKWNGIGVEKEWNRKGKKIKFTVVNIRWNGIELEWKWNGTFTTKKNHAKSNGNGKQI